MKFLRELKTTGLCVFIFLGVIYHTFTETGMKLPGTEITPVPDVPFILGPDEKVETLVVAKKTTVGETQVAITGITVSKSGKVNFFSMEIPDCAVDAVHYQGRGMERYGEPCSLTDSRVADKRTSVRGRTW